MQIIWIFDGMNFNNIEWHSPNQTISIPNTIVNEIENLKAFPIKRENKKRFRFFCCAQLHCFVNVELKQKDLIKRKYPGFRRIQVRFIHRFDLTFCGDCIDSIESPICSLCVFLLQSASSARADFIVALQEKKGEKLKEITIHNQEQEEGIA